MTSEIFEFKQRHKSQFEILNQYRERIKNLIGHDAEIRPVTKVENGNEFTQKITRHF